MAKKSETEKQLTSAAALIGMSHGRLSVMIARERVNLADVKAIVLDLRRSTVILDDLISVLEQKQMSVLPGLENVPAE